MSDEHKQFPDGFECNECGRLYGPEAPQPGVVIPPGYNSSDGLPIVSCHLCAIGDYPKELDIIRTRFNYIVDGGDIEQIREFGNRELEQLSRMLQMTHDKVQEIASYLEGDDG